MVITSMNPSPRRVVKKKMGLRKSVQFLQGMRTRVSHVVRFRKSKSCQKHLQLFL